MRKLVIPLLALVFITLLYFTIVSAVKVFTADDLHLPSASDKARLTYRIILITQDLQTPFWDQVSAGALEEAKKDGARLEVWGSYGNDEEAFLKKIELAIYSKVDGIIVQGLDTDKFKNLTKIKAASYGIPIITVANDVPMEESLRRTYVGSNQSLAGKLIAKQLLSDMGTKGQVVLMYNSQHKYYQMQRLAGIKEVLNNYPNIHIVDAETDNNREKVTAETKNLLNKLPSVDAFITVNSDFTEPVIKEIERRTQVAPYYIYSFDDNPELLSLLKQGKLDGVIEQSPKKMGVESVNLMMKWLKNETVPLNLNGYHTNIRIIKATDVQ